MTFKKRKNNGFTLIEILLVIAFAAIAGLGIYTVATKVLASNYANTEKRNIDIFRNGIKSLFAGQTTTQGLTNLMVNNAGITPKNMTTTNAGNIINSFGGSVVITPQTIVAGVDGFRISYYNVPSDICLKLITSSGNTFERVVIGLTSVKQTGTNSPVDLIAASIACSEDTGQGVTINFDALK